MQAREKRRRRRHAPAFKAAAVAACRKPGASVAGVALDLQLNANMLRSWIKRSASAPAMTKTIPAPGPPMTAAAFLPLRIESQAAPISTAPSTDRPIRVHIRRGKSRIAIEWPTSAAGACAVWLRELLG